MGDVNFDGKVDLIDAVLTQKYIARLTAFADEQIFFADVSKENGVEMADVVMMQKYIARLIKALGVGIFKGK
ncbi:hypothetical protein AGMMS50284_2610 [Clostridia bacterium]|nr:hypothetical protein AGMMS50284_2440 [Clostridia bacterium]GHU81848.1 hypothetical protein AGMMS50284_2610 [Clostridia bacterium]